MALGGSVGGWGGDDGVGRVGFDDLEALGRRDGTELVGFEFETAVEDTDAHHGQELNRITG